MATTTPEGLQSRWNLGRERFSGVGEKVGEKVGTVLNRERLGNVNLGKTERWASVLGGAALAALALRSRNRKAGLGIAALTGLPLLWRGATGHCAVYQKMGIDRTNGLGTGAGTSLASDHASTDSMTSMTSSASMPSMPSTTADLESINPSQL